MKHPLTYAAVEPGEGPEVDPDVDEQTDDTEEASAAEEAIANEGAGGGIAGEIAANVELLENNAGELAQNALAVSQDANAAQQVNNALSGQQYSAVPPQAYDMPELNPDLQAAVGASDSGGGNPIYVGYETLMARAGGARGDIEMAPLGASAAHQYDAVCMPVRRSAGTVVPGSSVSAAANRDAQEAQNNSNMLQAAYPDADANGGGYPSCLKRNSLMITVGLAGAAVGAATAGTLTAYFLGAFSAGGKNQNSTPSASEPPAPTVPPTGLTATAHDQTSILLQWTPVVGAQTVVKRGSTVLTTLPVGQNSYTDTGLTAANAYSYTLAAQNVTGTSPDSAAVSATTLQNAPSAPTAAPTGLTATAQDQISILLQWTPVAGAQTVVKRGSTVIATLPAGQNAYVDTGLTAATTYSYTLAAKNAAGASLDSASVSATTLQNPPPAPTAPPAGLMVTAAGQTSMLLQWTPVTGAQTVVKRGGTVIATLPLGQNSYTDTGLTATTTYSYTLAAKNAAGASPDSASVSASTWQVPPPAPTTAPTGLAAVVQGTTSILLLWVPVLGLQTVVKRNGAVIATVAAGGNSFTDTGLTVSTAYSYTVAFQNVSGTSADSAAVSVTTSSAPLEAPPVPSGFFGVAYDQDTIRLSWLFALGAESYTISRASDPTSAQNGSFTPIVQDYVPSTPTLRLYFDDTNTSLNTEYYYTISAKNVSGTSADSPFIQVNSMTTCDVLMRNAVTGWNNLAEATFWIQVTTWLQTSSPSLDCQLNVVNFSLTLADMSAAPAFTTEALIQAQVDALLADYAKSNTLTIYNNVAALTGPNGATVPRYEKLNILSRVLASIIAASLHKKKKK